MARLSRSRLRWILVTLAVVVVATAGVVWLNRADEPPAVHTRSQTLDGAGRGIRLDSTLYLPERTPAPAIIVAHGFGGSKQSVDSDARELAQRGFVVLTYSARGFGRSTGQISLNSRDAEVADASKLVSWLGTRPEVVQDGPDDPRVGVTGGSYGGALTLLLAGTDKRVDALAPTITYNDLSQALLPNSATPGRTPDTPAANAFAPNGVFKRSWAGIFFGAGVGGASLSDPSTDAVEPGSQDDDAAAPTDPGAAPADAGPSGGAPPTGGGGVVDGQPVRPVPRRTSARRTRRWPRPGRRARRR